MVELGIAIGFGTVVYIDYQDVEIIFNGSVKWYDYLGTMVLCGVIGGVIGAGIGSLITHFTGVLGFSITHHTIVPIKYVTVLGSMPAYGEAAKATSSGCYLINNGLWHRFSPSDRWIDNVIYINDAYKLGSQFTLYVEKGPKELQTLLMEIQYLIEHGIP